MTVEESSYILLLPVVGALYYKDSRGNEMMINAGELLMINLPCRESFEISNPYENDLVNFLQIRIQSGIDTPGTTPLLFRFNLAENKNQLLDINNTGNIVASYPYCSIGQFDGREEAVYRMKNSRHGLFVFVIEGAFEVQGRLLHPRDALALWDISEPVDLEALSNEAIIFMVEVN